MRYMRNTVLLSGWLFADILLGLMVIFMVSLPGSVPPKPPQLVVSPMELSPNSPACNNDLANLRCVLTVKETAGATLSVKWRIQNDFSQDVRYSLSSGILQPAQSVNITITSITCQNGSFIFSGAASLVPVIVQLSCTPAQQRLERVFCRIKVNDIDPDKFSKDGHFAESTLLPQINALTWLQGREVGLVIATGGVDNIDVDADRGTQMAAQAYRALQDMSKHGPLFAHASYYSPFFTTVFNSSYVIVDVYLVVRPTNAQDTCNSATHLPS